MTLNYNHLYYFHVAASESSLSAAAAKLGGYVVIVPRSVVRDALAAGRVRILAQIESVHAGVHALYQDGTAAELAQRAIEKLIATAQASAAAN